MADACMITATVLVWQRFGTLEFSGLFAAATELARLGTSPDPAILTIAFLLVSAALLKSAQFPFCFWIPRAMEGPTPSSAIFYGALSIHLGVFLLLRTEAIWGFDITADPRNARGAIGIVPQELNMDPFFTPYESLEMQAGFYGVPKNERRTDEILAAVGLLDKRDAYARTLSGGMKRRLLVAKALVHTPPVVVLDEPTAGVDVDLRKQLWAYIKTLHAQGVTIVLTTHYLEEAQELCDTIAIIDHGEVIACEPTPQILRRLDKRTLVIVPQTDLAAPPAALAGLEAVVRKDGALAISYSQGTRTVEELLDRVKAAGVAIRDLSTEEPDLEDVFVALTSAPRPA
jgi:ABC-2 type transport system ATP-binding protein